MLHLCHRTLPSLLAVFPRRLFPAPPAPAGHHLRSPRAPDTRPSAAELLRDRRYHSFCASCASPTAPPSPLSCPTWPPREPPSAPPRPCPPAVPCPSWRRACRSCWMSWWTTGTPCRYDTVRQRTTSNGRQQRCWRASRSAEPLHAHHSVPVLP